MKILFLGAFGKGALENFYVDGFSQFPVSLDSFDITAGYYKKIAASPVNRVLNKIVPSFFFQEINRSLLSYLQSRQYDVILVFKGLTLFPETISELKKHTHLLACYNPDHPFRFHSEGSGNRNILESIRRYDLYINYAGSVSAELAKRYQVAVATIPFGYDNRPFQTPAEEWLKELRSRLIFIGTFDRERANFLHRLDEESLVIFGDDKWRTRTSAYRSLRKSFSGRSLFEEAYKSAHATALASINLLRKQNLDEQSHNMRSFEIPGYGGLMLSNRTSEQECFFEDMKEVVFFDDTHELRDKISYLKNHPEKVENMKKAARRRSEISGYSYQHRSREMHDLFRQYLKS